MTVTALNFLSTQDICLDVLYEDEDFCVIQKPAQLMLHRTAIATADQLFLVDIAKAQFGRPIYLVHRLDRGTSGALLIAFTSEMASLLGKQLMAGDMDKSYAVMTRGWMKNRQTLDYPLKVIEEDAGSSPGIIQSAVSHFTPLAWATVPVVQPPYEATRLTFLRADILTGRRHQIRRHLKHLSHPVIGDATYGKGPLNRALASFWGVNRLMLHAASLAFTHPITGKRVSVKAPLEARMQGVVERLGWVQAYEKAF